MLQLCPRIRGVPAIQAVRYAPGICRAHAPERTGAPRRARASRACSAQSVRGPAAIVAARAGDPFRRLVTAVGVRRAPGNRHRIARSVYRATTARVRPASPHLWWRLSACVYVFFPLALTGRRRRERRAGRRRYRNRWAGSRPLRGNYRPEACAAGEAEAGRAWPKRAGGGSPTVLLVFLGSCGIFE